MRSARPGSCAAQQLDGGSGSEHVGQVREVDELDELFRAEVREEPPQRLTFALGSKVPCRIDDGRDG